MHSRVYRIKVTKPGSLLSVLLDEELTELQVVRVLNFVVAVLEEQEGERLTAPSGGSGDAVVAGQEVEHRGSFLARVFSWIKEDSAKLGPSIFRAF
jgi:hypothetical protein